MSAVINEVYVTYAFIDNMHLSGSIYPCVKVTIYITAKRFRLLNHILVTSVAFLLQARTLGENTPRSPYILHADVHLGHTILK